MTPLFLISESGKRVKFLEFTARISINGRQVPKSELHLPVEIVIPVPAPLKPDGEIGIRLNAEIAGRYEIFVGMSFTPGL